MILGGVATNYTSGDLNTLTTPGRYSVALASTWDNISNKPANWSGAAGIIIVEEGSTSVWRTQRINAQDGSNWVRHIYTSNAAQNTGWIRLDNFGCNDLSSLASALGGVVQSITQESDANDFITPGKLYSWSTATPTNAPYSYGCLKVVIADGVNSIVQICSRRSTNRDLCVRHKDGGSWSSWSRIYDESILTNSTLLSPLASALGVNKSAIALNVNSSYSVGGKGVYLFSWNHGERNCLVSLYDSNNKIKILQEDYAGFWSTDHSVVGVYLYESEGALYLKNQGTAAYYISITKI